MMSKFTKPLFCIALALSFATTAVGQNADWYVAPSVVFTNDDGDRNIDDSLAGGQIAAGWNFNEYASLELMLGYSAIDGYFDDETHLDISANLLAAVYDRERTFVPYLMIGIGYLGVNFDSGGDENRPTGSLGLGFKWRMGESNFSIRGEHRARLAWEQDLNFTDYITTLGVQYNFGGPRRKPGAPPENDNPYIDTDGDGVLDIWDECPDTPKDVEVTSRGCPIDNIDRDSDGDHIIDSIDNCPNTPLGVPVDKTGCSLDSDRDGVTTNNDRCPSSPLGAKVNIYGCANDDDKDGVPNNRDDCPDTVDGARVDVYGCEFTDIITLPGVNFETGFDALLPGTEYLLENAATTLNRYPDMLIEVAGHTDSVGNPTANEGLSERRAKTVHDVLIRFGVDENRLTFKGYGQGQPIADNTTAEGRATNRRVELRLLKQ